MKCGKSYIWKILPNKHLRQKAWFEKWIRGHTTLQLAKISGHSKSTIFRILHRGLLKPVPVKYDLSCYKYLIFDGKYLFGRRYSLLVIMDAITRKPIICTIVKSESKKYVVPWLMSLKKAGLSPIAITTDGNLGVINSFIEVWPDIITQRCLFHIKLQSQAWIRAKPKYESALALLRLVSTLNSITNNEMAQVFIEDFNHLREKYKEEIKNLDRTHPVQSDLVRAYTLVQYALPNCFRYLDNSNIAKTTSALEGYFKQIQRIRGFQHNGLTENHLFQFIYWKIYFDSK